MKQALITGANGFIGSYLTKYLAENGIYTTAFILKGTKCQLLEQIYPSMENVSIIEGNILDEKMLEKLVKDKHYIVHLAGVIQGYIQEDYDRINVKGTENILNACVNFNPIVERIILASSSAAAGFGTPENPLRENSKANPIPNDFYGISKYKMENLANNYNGKLPITIVRPCSVLGPGNNVTLGSYQLVKKRFKLQFLGPKRPISYIDVEDLVKGFYLCLIKQKAKGEVFYFCNDRITTLAELQEIASVTIFNRKYGKLIGIPLTKFMFRVGAILMEGLYKIQKKQAPFINQGKVLGVFAPGQVASSEKAKKLLEWKTSFSITETVYREGNWFIEQGWMEN